MSRTGGGIQTQPVGPKVEPAQHHGRYQPSIGGITCQAAKARHPPAALQARYEGMLVTYRPYFLFSFLFSSASTADILWMHNGDRLMGAIEDVTDEQLRIKPPYSSTITIHRNAIKRWHVVKKNKSKPTIKKGIPLLKKPANDGNAWFLTGSGDLDIKLKNKDKKTNNIKIKTATELANLDWRYSVDGEYLYETVNSVTNSHEYRLKPMLDIFFDESWFARSSIDLGYDLIDAAYLNVGYASGLGYRFWNDKRHRLELIGQVGLQRTYYTPSYWSNLDLFDDSIINYPLISLGWDYRHSIILWQEKIEVFSKGTYEKYVRQPIPALTLEQGINSDVGLRYYFNDHLRLSLSSELVWYDLAFNYRGDSQNIDQTEWRHFISLGASL